MKFRPAILSNLLRGYFLVVITVALSGCVTERLRDDTVSVTGTSGHISQQMVLSNVLRDKLNPHSLPWAFTLASGTVSVNSTTGLMGTYSETWPKITQGVTPNVATLSQQTFGIIPLTDPDALKELEGYFDDASTNTPISTDDSKVKEVADRLKLRKNIPTDCFKFTTSGIESLPAGCPSCTIGSTTVYVTRDGMTEFVNFTLLIVHRIDAIQSTKPTVSPGLQDYQLLQ